MTTFDTDLSDNFAPLIRFVTNPSGQDLRLPERWLSFGWDRPIGTLAVMTRARNAVYATPGGIWLDVLAKQPASTRALWNVAAACVEYGALDSAFRYADEATDLNPAADPQAAAGFDCSGFVRFVYRHFGVDLPHNSWGQAVAGSHVSRGQLKPGDLVFFAGEGHVGLYIGNGRFIHAPHSGTRVSVSSLNGGWYGATYDGARRIVGLMSDTLKARLEITKDGVFYSPPSTVTEDVVDKVLVMGDFEKWKEVFNLYAKPGLEPHAFAALTAFGSPLLKFTGLEGAIIIENIRANKEANFGFNAAFMKIAVDAVGTEIATGEVAERPMRREILEEVAHHSPSRRTPRLVRVTGPVTVRRQARRRSSGAEPSVRSNVSRSSSGISPQFSTPSRMMLTHSPQDAAWPHSVGQM